MAEDYVPWMGGVLVAAILIIVLVLFFANLNNTPAYTNLSPSQQNNANQIESTGIASISIAEVGDIIGLVVLIGGTLVGVVAGVTKLLSKS